MAESKTWNGSGQLASISLSSYALSGGMQYSYSATQNNGQITQAVDTFSGETIVYQYDLLKRLVSSSATPTSGSTSAPWTETFQYDGFGNLTAKVLNGTSTPIPVNAATNQLTNAFYDANGNMTSGAGASFTYDVSNRIATAMAVSGANYGNEYAPDNKRIHETPYTGTDEWMFYGAAGEKLGVYSIGQWYDNNGNAHSVFSPMRTSIWFAGKLIYENGLVYLDRLGTNHAQSAQFLPFGDEITSTSNDRTKFATYTRDSYTGLDYADQRFYASTYGRFMTPDPSAKSAKDGTPGSWNRYSYVQGDPVNRKDPRGLDICEDDPDYCDGFFTDPYGENDGTSFASPNCGTLTLDYIDNAAASVIAACFATAPVINSGGGGCATTYTSATHVFYTCFHQSGKDWRLLTKDLKHLEKKLDKDPTCEALLTSKGTSMSTVNSDLTTMASSTFILADTISNLNTAPASSLYGTTGDVPGLPPIVINSYLFQNSSLSQDNLTILHEMAHLFNVFGADNVAGNPSSAQNDQTVINACSQIGVSN
jgi:RHS repeat-associated protein